MPFLDVRIGQANRTTSANNADIARSLTQLTTERLGKRSEVTAVAIQWLPATDWFIGGESLSTTGQTSFFLKIEITAGTNTKDQKAAFVASIFSAMETLLGPLAPASYVVVQEVAADSWGYAGRTQEFRYIEGKRL